MSPRCTTSLYNHKAILHINPWSPQASQPSPKPFPKCSKTSPKMAKFPKSPRCAQCSAKARTIGPVHHCVAFCFAIKGNQRRSHNRAGVNWLAPVTSILPQIPTLIFILHGVPWNSNCPIIIQLTTVSISHVSRCVPRFPNHSQLHQSICDKSANPRIPPRHGIIASPLSHSHSSHQVFQWMT